VSGLEFDFSEMKNLAVSFGQVPPALKKNLVKAVAVAALKGKAEWKKAARQNAGPHLPAYPASIDYSKVRVVDGGVETEVGPNLTRKQGFAGIVEDAPGGVRGTPQRNYEKASKVIAADLTKGVLIAIEQAGKVLDG